MNHIKESPKLTGGVGFFIRFLRGEPGDRRFDLFSPRPETTANEHPAGFEGDTVRYERYVFHGFTPKAAFRLPAVPVVESFTAAMTHFGKSITGPVGGR